MKNNPSNIVRRDFEEVKRNFERAYATGDYAAELMELATAVAHSVLAKCIDPQRKAAATNDKVSDSGFNPALVKVKRSIRKDFDTLNSTAAAVNAASRLTFSADGDIVREVINPAAEEAANKLIRECLDEGIDLVQEAACTLLELAAEHANGENWLDRPYSVRRLSKRVLIREDESVAFREEETVAIVETYRAIRRAVANSRAMRTDPRNGYSYLEEVYEDSDSGEEVTCYRRLDKYADLGGNVSTSFTGEDFGGAYTVDAQTVMDYNVALSRLNLTDRQATIIQYRMRGMGYKAIATRLGVHFTTVQKTMVRLRKHCEDIGFSTAK